MKNNNIIQKSKIQQINSKKYDIISFGYFPNFFNNKINYKEYNLSVIEDEGVDEEEEICNNKLFKKINKSSSSCKKLIKKKQLSKSSNVIATLILPKSLPSNSNTNETTLLDHDDELMMKLNQQQQENKNKFTWVYYQFDYYGKRKTIYDDSTNTNTNTTTTTIFPEKIICSKCCSLERSVFKLNNGNLDCSFCLKYSE